MSSAFKALHDENSTTHQTTVPETPQQNGVAERLNRVLVEMARPMMRHKDVDQDLWADAIKTVVYIKNRFTNRALSVGKTPFEHSRLSTMRTARRTRPRCPTRRSRTELLSGSTESSWRWLAP